MTPAGERGPVSVIVPAWDLGEELVECLDSVERQEGVSRVIVVDNASTSPFPTGRHRPEILRLPTRVSVGAARNAGLGLVRSELVCFMDADDVLLPGAFSILLAAFRRVPDASAVAGRILIWDPGTDRRIDSYYPSRAAFLLQGLPRPFALLNGVHNMTPTTGAVLMRADAARAAGGFADRNRTENWPLGISLALAGRFVLVDRPCKLYRVGPARASLRSALGHTRSDAWSARSEVRRRLRTSPGSTPAAAVLAAAALPFHAVQSLRAARERAPRYMRELGLA